MDAEFIRVSTSPAVRSTPPSPSAEQSGAPSTSAGNSGKVEIPTEGDTVTLSSKGPAEQQGEANVAAPKTLSGSASSQTRLEVTDKNEVVLKVIDTNTGQVIKEIPAREQQRLSQAIQDTVDKLANNSHK